MTDLLTSSPRTFYGPPGQQFKFPFGAAVFAGSAVMAHTDGSVVKVAQSAGAFVGFAEEDITAADIAAGIFGLVREKGRVWLTVGKGSAFALTDMGATVYASDGNTFTLTSTNNASIGKVVGFRPEDVVALQAGGTPTSLEVLVDFEGQNVRSI